MRPITKNEQTINGMQLPPRLVSALGDGTWRADGKNWKLLFPADEVVLPTLYDLDLMRRENESWRDETEPTFLGVTDSRVLPGSLDPAKSILIGDLQPDAMIALDYRQGGLSPSVVFLSAEGRWVEVARSFDEFWGALQHGV